MDGKKIEQEILEITEELIKDYKSDFGTHLNDDNELVTDELEKVRIKVMLKKI